MKKILLTISIFLCVLANAQNYPTGQKIVQNAKTHELYKDIPRANFSNRVKRSKADDITFIDNSKNKYFPPVIDQVMGSCAFASGIGYIYNYEYNAANDLDSSTPENIYNYLQVYAFLNGGEDVGGHSLEGWKFLQQNGVPSIKDGKTISHTEWCSGYRAYYNGMEKSMLEYSQFVSDEPGEIEKMKEYLIDHGNGSKVGGLIQFSAWAHPLDPVKYNGPSSTGYDAMIHHFGNDGMHSMTIVGFDDAVEWDFNEDGVIQDEEKGAFICVNSWGDDWGDRQGCNSKGRFYSPYYTFKTLRQSGHNVPYTKYNMGGGTGNGGKNCLIVTPKKAEKRLSLKFNISHDSRNDLEFEVGVAKTKGATKPQYTSKKYFMKHQGGDFPMKGKRFGNSKDIEFGINIDELVEYIGNATDVTYFVKVIDKSAGTVGTGSVQSCSLFDYRHDINNPIEYISTIDKAQLKNGVTATCTIKTSIPALENGFNSNLSCLLDEYGKRVFVYLNSNNGGKAKVDLIKNNEVIKPLFFDNISKGFSNKIFSIDKSLKGQYYVRVVFDGRFIYKSITLK